MTGDDLDAIASEPCIVTTNGGAMLHVDRRDALVAEVRRLRAENAALAAAIKAIPRHRRGNDPCTYGACMVCAAPWPCPTENVRAALAALDADALADLIGAVHAFRDDLRQDPLDGAWVATSATVDGIDAALAALDGTP